MLKDPKSFLNFLLPLALLLGFCLAAADPVLAATRYSVATGNWNVTTTWSTTDGGAPGASVPANGDTVTIDGNHNVTLNVNMAATISSLTISSGSTLTTTASNTVTATTITVNGTYVNGSTGTITKTTMTVGAGGTYQHNINGGTIPTATWNAASNCKITGTTSTTPTFGAQAFGNLIIDPTNITANITETSDAYSVAGNLQIIGTQTTYWWQLAHTPLTVSKNLLIDGSIYSIGGSVARILNVTGDLSVEGGTFLMNNLTNGIINETCNVTGDVAITSGSLIMSKSSSATGIGTLNANGDFSITGTGTMDFSGGTGTQTSVFNLKGNYTQSGGTVTVSTTAAGKGSFNFNGTATQTFSKTSGTISCAAAVAALTITVSSGATVDFGTSVLDSSGGGATKESFTNNGTMEIGSSAGITSSGATGNIQVAGTRTFPASSSYIYDANGAQATGNGLPTAAITGNVTVNNGATVTATNAIIMNSPGELTVNGILIPGAAAQVFSGTGTLTGSGTVEVNRTAATADFLSQYTESTRTLTNLTVEYAVLTGSQVVSSTTYNNLRLDNTSGTNTAGGAVTVNGTLTTATGGTLDLGTANTLGGTLASITNNGSIKTSVPTGTSAVPLASGKTWGGTGTVEYAATTPQTALIGTYNDLTFSGAGAKTITSGTVTVGGNLSVTSGTADASVNNANVTVTGNIIGGGPIKCGSGTISLGGNWTNVGTFTCGTGTVNYTSASAAQAVANLTYNNLTFTGAGVKNFNSGTATVGGDLNVTSGTADASVNNANVTVTGNITGGGPITSGSGTISLAGNWTNVGTFTCGTGTVNYTKTTGGQTVASQTYNNLTLSNTSGTDSPGGNITVNGTFITTAGGTLDMTGSCTLGGTLSTITNNGTIKTSVPTAISATPIPSGKTWGGTVEYAAGTPQTVLVGTYNDLIFSVLGTKTITSGTVTVGGNWSVTSGTADASVNNASVTVTGNITGSGPITSGSGTISLGGNWTNSGTFTCGTGTVTYTSASAAQTVASLTYNNLTFTGAGVKNLNPGTATVGGNWSVTSGTADASVNNAGVTVTGDISGTGPIKCGSGTISLAGNWTNSGTFTCGTGTVTYTSASAAQTVADLTYNKLTFTGAGVKNFNSGTATVGGNWSVTGGTADASVNNANVTVTGNILGTGPIKCGSGTISLAGFWVDSGTFTCGTGTVIYNNASAARTVASLTYNNLTFTGGGVKTLDSGTAIVGGNWSVTGGTADASVNNAGVTVTGNIAGTGPIMSGSGTISLGGNWTNSGTFTCGTGSVLLNGISQQTISPTLTFYDLTITNASGSDDPGDGVSFTPGVIFSTGVTSTHNYTITTPSVRVQYNTGSTYTFNNINWNGGAASTNIFFRNSSLSSGSWLLNVSGTQTAVSFVNVARSDASGGSAINANDGTCYDGQNNVNWFFGPNRGFFNVF